MLMNATVKVRKNKRDEEDESFSSSEDEERPRDRTTWSAKEYQVTQVMGNTQENTDLDLITLPIRKTKRGKRVFCSTQERYSH